MSAFISRGGASPRTSRKASFEGDGDVKAAAVKKSVTADQSRELQVRRENAAGTPVQALRQVRAQNGRTRRDGVHVPADVGGPPRRVQVEGPGVRPALAVSYCVWECTGLETHSRAPLLIAWS